nr:zinc finger BED domain-containing protein 4-like [Labrus bergylta]
MWDHFRRAEVDPFTSRELTHCHLRFYLADSSSPVDQDALAHDGLNVLLYDLLDKGRSPPTLKVYVAAISCQHPDMDSGTVGSHKQVSLFLRGAQRLHPTQYVPLLLDIQDNNFLHVCDFKNVSVLLDCLEMSDRHTADNLAEQLLRVAREWNIVHKVVACVSDNAANVVKAIQNTGWPHLFCFAHTLNLIVHSGIAAIKPTVDKVKAIVEYMHKSTVASEKLKATQNQLGLPELRLKQDCPTRWNSTYYMLERILQNREAVITTLALTNPRLATLSPEEWEEMQQACNVLKPFEEVTVEISGEGYVTASKVILLARGLQKIASSHQRAAGNLSEPVRKLVDNICSQMSHRFHKIESHVLLSEAAALDPRFKKKAFRQDEAADNVFHRLCNSAARMTFPNQQAEGEEEGAEAQEGSATQESAVWKEFDEQVFGLVTSSRNPTADSVLEVRGFIEEPLVPRSSNPLTWWQSRRVVYPRLCEFMKRRLCIVATSVPSERVFSKTGQIVSERRSRLSSSKVRQLVFINANLNM